MIRKIYKGLGVTLLVLLALINTELKAQEFPGGTHIYGFLTQSPSARQTALGNAAISYAFPVSDVMFSNPALLSHKHNYSASVQHQFQFAGIANGTASYAQSLIDTSWTFGLGVQYINYGDFRGFDEYEINTGDFSAQEVAVQLSAAKQIGPRLHIGSSLKFINSGYEQYSSTGLGVDIGAHYFIEEQNLGFSFLMSDLVFQMTAFNEREQAPPVDFQIGVSKRLDHIPMRFQLTYHHLNKWKLLQEESGGSADLFDQGKKSRLDIFANDLMSHIVFSAEVGVGKNEPVYLRVGYNHIAGQMLSVDYYKAFAGISAGLGLNIKGIRFDYGYYIAHLAGGRHHIGLAYSFGRKSGKTELRD